MASFTQAVVSYSSLSIASLAKLQSNCNDSSLMLWLERARSGVYNTAVIFSHSACCPGCMPCVVWHKRWCGVTFRGESPFVIYSVLFPLLSSPLKETNTATWEFSFCKLAILCSAQCEGAVTCTGLGSGHLVLWAIFADGCVCWGGAWVCRTMTFCKWLLRYR